MFSSSYLALILAFYIIGFALLFLEALTKKSGFIIPLIAFSFFVAGTIVALLTGAKLFEVALVGSLYLLVCIFAFRRVKGK